MIVSTLGLEEPWRSRLDRTAGGRPVRHCALAELTAEELNQLQMHES